MDCYGSASGYGDYRHGMIGGSNSAAYHPHQMPNYAPPHMHNYHPYNYHQPSKMHQAPTPSFRCSEGDSSALACDRFGYGSNVNGMPFGGNYGSASHSFAGPVDSRPYSQHHFAAFDSYSPGPSNYPPHTQFPYPPRDYHGYDGAAYKARISAENYMPRDPSYHQHHQQPQPPPPPPATPYMSSDYYGTHSNAISPASASGTEHYPSSAPYRAMHASNFSSDYHKNLPLVNQYANDATGFSSNMDSGNQI